MTGKAVKYRHYKGGLYEVICEARLESDPAITMVVYRAADGSIWTRTSTNFNEMVEVNGEWIARFALVN